MRYPRDFATDAPAIRVWSKGHPALLTLRATKAPGSRASQREKKLKITCERMQESDSLVSSQSPFSAQEARAEPPFFSSAGNVSRMPSLPNEPAVKEEMENSNFQQRYTTVYAPRLEPEASGTRGHRALQKGVSSKRPMVHGVLPQKRAAAAEDCDDLLDERLLAEAEGDLNDESVGTSRKRQPASRGSPVRNGDIASGHMKFTAASKVNARDTSMQVPNSALAGFAYGSPSTSTSVLPDTSTLSTLPASSLIDAPDEPPLSAEQQSILRRVQAGESIFFTVSMHSVSHGLIWPNIRRL